MSEYLPLIIGCVLLFCFWLYLVLSPRKQP